MKRFLKIAVPIFLTAAILVGIGWYLFSYDKGLTQDIFLSCGRFFAGHDNMKVASKCYEFAYRQDFDRNAVAIEWAEQYIKIGNYTKAEYALNKAIDDGANAAVYTALSKAYVAQDKLYDAVMLLSSIPDAAVKAQLDALRPAAPEAPLGDQVFTELADYAVNSDAAALYVNSSGEYPSVETDLYTGPIQLKEGENILYAIAVSESGLVSPLQIFKPTVKGVIQEVQFHDAHIEVEVRKVLRLLDHNVIYSDLLWEITEFTVPENARDLTDLQHMLHLQSLTLQNGSAGQLSQIDNNLHSFQDTLLELTVINTPLSAEDLDFISSLVNLTSLTLENCSLSTAEPLSSLTRLETLNLNSNSIRNIQALGFMPNLKHLSMHRNALEDLQILSNCTQLQTLDISNNLLTQVAPLATLTSLREINISNNQIDSIVFVSALTDLMVFSASYNSIADITPLKNCRALTKLEITNNIISDLTPIAGHTQITHLDFSHNLVATLPQWAPNSAFITINGSYNYISDLSPLGNLQLINNIHMDYNEDITSVEALANCPLLIKVNIYGTQVTDVSMLVMQSIIVNYNPLEEINAENNN